MAEKHCNCCFRIYIYNSVLTCREHIINSSASAPPNATKIAVKKVSDVDVCMFGPELQFSMYTCCLLVCFCARQRTHSKVKGRCETAGPIGTRFGTHVHIHLGMDVRQTNCPKRHKGAFGGGFRGSNIQKSGEAVKRLDRLAPTLVHVCGFLW